MTISAHTIQSTKGTRRSSKRLGRGNGSGKGTYAARGLKGQRSRSGGKGGLQRIGFKASLQKIPKLRGFKSLSVRKEVVTLETLNRVCTENDVVTPLFLHKKGIIDHPQKGVKIVATGALNKKLTIKDCLASKGALKKIEAAGGQLVF
ncbi:50S ribosomal protein L15 [Patescibacteria group bacterium]|nr:50S ribosomal protein L15 [Patescibacteria group bacterium]MBU1721591.1 50S ribosomal protein L15 [Patescibacteria group bacterium]MBU1901817.1 50S ribosomal protein L15 [Patescibacteria group bacterium]